MNKPAKTERAMAEEDLERRMRDLSRASKLPDHLVNLLKQYHNDYKRMIKIMATMPQSFNEIARLHAALPPSQQSPPAPGYDPANNIILFPERRAQAEAVAAVRNAYTPGAAVQPANGGNVYGLQLGGPAANAHHHQPNLNQVLHQHPQPVPVAGGSSAAAGAQSAAAGAQNGGAAVSAHLMAMKLMLEQQNARQQAAKAAVEEAAVAAADAAAQQEEDVVGEEDEAELDHSNVYQQYRPAKLNEGRDHPDPIVESQSLAGVEPPPVDYQHHLGPDAAAGRISNAQLETVVYACMRFRHTLPSGERAGFFLGDGAGVGKGRQLAALSKELWQCGIKRILWVSTSRDLAYDARRDLNDMGATNIPVFPKGKEPVPNGDLNKILPNGGCLFITYSLLITKGRGGGGGGRAKSAGPPDSDDAEGLGDEAGADRNDLNYGMNGGADPVMNANQRKKAERKKKQKEAREKMSKQLQGKESRMTQIMNWLQGPKSDKGENALIIFDECHRAKNLLDSNGNSTLTGIAVDQIQRLLPKARVIYSSATGASEPQNLLFMRRLGSFGFNDMEDMVAMLKKSGMGAIEMFAMGLKGMGAYLSRTLSYRDAEFRLEQIELDPGFRVLYNRTTQLWALVHSVLKSMPRPPGMKGRDIRKGLFWSAHQRFYKCLLMAAKVRKCAELAKDALRQGMCVVIGLQSTGEANMSQAREQEGDDRDDLVSAPKMVLQGFISKHLFRPPYIDPPSQYILLAQVAQAVQTWRGLPTCEQQAVLELKEEDQRRKRMERRKQEAEERAQRAAARQQQGLAGLQAAMDEDEDEDEVVVAGEANLEEVLQNRRHKALLTGNFIDLTNDDEEATAAAMARLKEEEAEEARAAAEKEVEARIQALRNQVEESLERLRKLESMLGVKHDEELLRMPELTRNEDSEGPSNGGASRKRKAPTPAEELEDDSDDGSARAAGGQMARKRSTASLANSTRSGQGRAGPSGAGAKPAAAGGGAGAPGSAGKVEAVIVLDDSSEDEGPKRPARGARAAPAVAVKKEKAAGRTAGQELEDDLEDEDAGPSKPRFMARRTAKVTMDLLSSEDEEMNDNKSDVTKEEEEEEDTTEEEEEEEQESDQTEQEEEEDEEGEEGEEDSPEKPKPIPGSVARARSEALKLKQELKTLAANRHREVDKLTEAKIAANAPPPLPPRHEHSAGGSGAGPSNAGGAGLTRRGSNPGNGPAIDPDNLPAYRMAVPNRPLPAQGAGAQQNGGAGGRGRGRGGAGGGRGRGRRGNSKEPSDNEGSSDYEPADDDDLDGDLLAEDNEAPLPPLLKRVRALLLRLLDAQELPPNPLDHLTELLGGEANVAEMTGRKGLMVKGEDGRVKYKQRREGEMAQNLVNLKEKEDFMEGNKLIAIISEAASTGISLQADRRVRNQRRRFHITLELPWSADKAIQQFGRSHRSNQSSAPIYCLLVSKCGGEYRFAGAVAKRLASLGALLQGDQRALGAAANLRSYDVDNEYARQALARVYDDICTNQPPMPGVRIPHMSEAVIEEDQEGAQMLAAVGGQTEELEAPFLRNLYFRRMRDALVFCGLCQRTNRDTVDVGDVKLKQDVPRFLNRLLGLQVIDQQLLFEYFSATLHAVIRAAKTEGRYQEGIAVLRDVSVAVEEVKDVHKDEVTGAVTRYMKLKVDDGVSWERAVAARDAMREELKGMGATDDRIKKSGFWIARRDWMAWKRPHIILATEVARRHSDSRVIYYRVMRPYQAQTTLYQEIDVKEKYRMASSEAEAKKLWLQWYDCMLTGCMHGPNCQRRKREGFCDSGSRTYYKHIVTGALLPVMRTLFDTVLTSAYGRAANNYKPPPRALRATVTVTNEAAEALARNQPLAVDQGHLASPEQARRHAQAAGGAGTSGRGAAGAGPSRASGAAASGSASQKQKEVEEISLISDDEDEEGGGARGAGGSTGAATTPRRPAVQVKVEPDRSRSGRRGGGQQQEVVEMEEGEGAGGAAGAQGGRQEEEGAREQLVVGFNLLAPDAELFMANLERNQALGLQGPPRRAG